MVCREGSEKMRWVREKKRNLVGQGVSVHTYQKCLKARRRDQEVREVLHALHALRGGASVGLCAFEPAVTVGECLLLISGGVEDCMTLDNVDEPWEGRDVSDGWV